MSRAIARREQSEAPQPITPAGNIVAKLAERFGNLEPIVARRNSQMVQSALRKWFPLRKGDDEKAKKRLAVLPEMLDLQSQLDSLWYAVWKPATEAEARLIVATMLEAIPAARTGATPTFIDGMIDALATVDTGFDDEGFSNYQGFRGFSCHVLFGVARHMISTSKFTPATSEILAAARKIRMNYWFAFHATDKLMGFRADAEDLLAIASAEVEGGESDGDDIPF